MTRHIIIALVLGATQLQAAEITHGPILGRLGSAEIGVWARTKHEGEFRVRYGTARGDLDQLSDPVRTTIDHDNANWVHITGLEPHTKYYYEVVGDPGSRSRGNLRGDFRTLPDNNTLLPMGLTRMAAFGKTSLKIISSCRASA